MKLRMRCSMTGSNRIAENPMMKLSAGHQVMSIMKCIIMGGKNSSAEIQPTPIATARATHLIALLIAQFAAPPAVALATQQSLTPIAMIKASLTSPPFEDRNDCSSLADLIFRRISYTSFGFTPGLPQTSN